MTLVTTQVGLVDRSLLEVKDSLTEDEQGRYLVTEWLLDGQVVRRDALVNLLRGIDLGVIPNG